MKITILNGTFDDTHNELSKKIVALLEEKNHTVTHLKIPELNIAYCTGCWSCWVKTPGRCVHNDDTQKVLRSTINADVVIHLTENKLGAVSSYTKTVMDKSIPLVHPYITVVNGESRHMERYKKYPKWGLIVIEPNKNKYHFELIKNHFIRAVLNGKTELLFSDCLTGQEELIDETNFIKWLA